MATPSSSTYAVLGSTGNTGTALIQNLLQRPSTQIRAYCRNKAKLLRFLPEIHSGNNSARVDIVEGSIQDTALLAKCVQGCRAVFLVVSTNNNVPGCRLSQDTAASVIRALETLRQSAVQQQQQQQDSTINDEEKKREVKMPKLVLLSSATIDPHLSRHTPRFLHKILLLSASNVYADLRVAESLLRAQSAWLTTIYIKPGALSLDKQRGHVLSLDKEESPLSYLDLAAAMIEAADDGEGRWDGRNVGVCNGDGGRAKFPWGTPLCILMGLVCYFWPGLYPYLPETGPGLGKSR
ncbi:MAG: hypothetical protein Q9227_004306 [Pyrenula ochraceoflavens]